MTKLTPYDTGERFEPNVWDTEGDHDRFGRVDFDNDESATEFGVCAKRGDDGGAVLEVNLMGAQDNFTVIVDGVELRESAPRVAFDALDHMLNAWESYTGEVDSFIQAWADHFNDSAELAEEYTS